MSEQRGSCMVCQGHPLWRIENTAPDPVDAEALATVTAWGCMEHVGEIAGDMGHRWPDRQIVATPLPAPVVPIRSRQEAE